MKTYITEATYNRCDNFSSISLNSYHIDISKFKHLFEHNFGQCEAELLFGAELAEYEKFKNNKEKIKNILGEDCNMEINIKEIVEKVLDERAANELHETNYEIERLKQKVIELEAANAELSADFDQLLEDEEEALDYIEELECELSEYEANEFATINDDPTDLGCCCAECNGRICGETVSCCNDRSLQIIPTIKNIFFCDEPGKEKTIVLFEDGTKVIKNVVEGDKFDLNVGVALCVAERVYGGKSRYHKMVKKIAGVKEKKKVETRCIKVEIPRNADIKQTVKVAKEVLTEKPEISEAELNAEVKKKVSKK